jgi:DNA-binding NarL/FixJ family response regulator
MILCKDCDKRLTCVELCEDAEAFVDQDYVSLKEKTIDPLQALYFQHGWPEVREKLTKREEQIVRLLTIGMKREEICKTLSITMPNCENIISRLKKKFL